MELLKLYFYGIVLFTGCFEIQSIQSRAINAYESNLLSDPKTANYQYQAGTEETTLHNCTADDICRCHSSKVNTLVADCSYLSIESIPQFHPDVTVIHLQGNKIKNVSGEGIPNTVTYLDLSGNKLNTFIEFPFKDMKQLEYLDLSNNTLPYTSAIYSENIFHGLANLRYLNIKQNNMFTLRNLHFPVGISSLNNLETLLLDGVDLLGFEERFVQLTKLKTLDLSGNPGVCNLGILRFNFFKNVSNVENVDISNCNIHKIELGTFRGLQNLHSLNISSNECLTFRVLANVTNDMQYTTIRVLDISRIHCTFGPSTVMHKEDIIHLKKTNLTHLYMRSNRLAMFEIGVAGKLPKTLTLLSVTDNDLSFGLYYIELLASLPNIAVVHAEHQGNPHNMVSGTSDCNDWRAPPSSHSTVSFGKSTELLYCNRNPLLTFSRNGDILTKMWFPPSLREFYYSNNAMNFEIGMLNFSENNIKVIDVSNNLFYSWRGPLINLPHVTHIDLSNNYCTYIADNFFMVENVLETLLIQNNLLGFVLYKDVNGAIFKNLNSLKILDLSTNHIYTLPTLLLKNQYELQTLNLSNNALSEFSINVSHMKSLKYLDLTHNQIRTIKRNQRDQIDSLRGNNLTLNLKGNRVDCSCEELEFLKWLNHNKVIFEHFNAYGCVFANGTEIDFSNFDATLMEISKSCASYIGIIAVFTSMIVLSLSLVICGVVYRYRWKLRYLFYMAKTRYKGYTPVANAEDDDDYIYDAFVSYCSEDYLFVREELLIELEENVGLRVCIHQRDFIPGEEIAQNITNAIHQSRKTVVLLSRSYLDSYWCMYEFNMARMESIYSRGGDSVLLLVFYEDIPARELPFTLMDLIESKSYIEYPYDDDHGKVVFWDKLATSISLYSTTSV